MTMCAIRVNSTISALPTLTHGSALRIAALLSGNAAKLRAVMGI
jgi:hypothetical protein